MAIKEVIEQRINANPAAKQIMLRTQKTRLQGFSLNEVARAFFRQLRRSNLFERASGISFNVVMAIPPTLIFVFTLVPYLPISQNFIHQLFGLIRDIVPGERNNAIIISFLRDFLAKPRNGLLSFGLLLAILFSSNAMQGVLRSFDKNYPGFVKRKGLKRRGTALQLTLVTFIFVSICILLIAAGAEVLRSLGVQDHTVRVLVTTLRWVVILLLTFYMVSFMYRYGPSVEEKWPLFTPGAVFATSLMIIASGLVSYYVNHFSNYNKLYGSISAIFILMSMIYANSLALLMGFELNVTLYRLKRHRNRRQSKNMEIS